MNYPLAAIIARQLGFVTGTVVMIVAVMDRWCCILREMRKNR